VAGVTRFGTCAARPFRVAWRCKDIPQHETDSESERPVSSDPSPTADDGSAANGPPMELARIALGEPFEGIELGYVDWGERSAERVIVCVHGLTRNARDFDTLARALAGRGARVLSVDMVGRGRSSWLANPEDYALPTYVGHLGRFLERLEIPRVDWIGTSMGGLIGMAIAAGEAPPIDRLVINDIGPFVPKAGLQQIQGYLGLDERFPSLEALESHLRTIHSSFGPLADAQWRHLAEHSARRTADGWRLHYDPDIRVPFIDLAAEDIDLWELWDKIACPTYVLHGAESVILPQATTEEMSARGPKAQVAHFAGIGHAPALVADDQIRTIAGWLDLGR